MATSCYILEVGTHDVICGRGAKANNNDGNKLFRHLITQHKMRYISAAKVDKPNVAREVVKIWRNQEPPGRFLMKVPLKVDENKTEDLWYDVGDDKARMKASQCLREKTPDVMPYIKMLKSHNTMQEALAAPISISTPCNANQFPIGIPDLSAPNTAVTGGASPANACLNPINGFLPIAPSMGMNFQRYLLNYQQNMNQNQQFVEQDQRSMQIPQKQPNENEENTPDFFGLTGSLALPNTSVSSHMSNNPALNATQVILSTFQTQHHQQQLPTNTNMPPLLHNNNNSYFPQSSLLQQQILPYNVTGTSSSSGIAGRKETQSQKTTDKLSDLTVPPSNDVEGLPNYLPTENNYSQHQDKGKFIESNIKEKMKLIANTSLQGTSTR